MTGAAARIGPNAIIQTVGVLAELRGAAATARFLRGHGLGQFADALPQEMVDEGLVRSLLDAVRADLGADAARVQQEAGERTARYLLAHRIPRPVQALLRLLPAPLAARVLLRAILAHAWTFVGSGAMEWRPARAGVIVVISGCPICRGHRAAAPACHFYAGTFAGLFRALVARATTVTETACLAAGGEACEFRLHWGSS